LCFDCGFIGRGSFGGVFIEQGTNQIVNGRGVLLEVVYDLVAIKDFIAFASFVLSGVID